MSVTPRTQSTAWVARMGLMVLVWLTLGLISAAPLFFGRRGWWDPVLQPVALWVHIYVSIFSVPFLAAKVWGTWKLLWGAPPGRQAPPVDRSASAVMVLFAIIIYGSGGLLAWNAVPQGNAWLKDVHLYSTLAMALPLTWHLARRLGQSWRSINRLALGSRPGSWHARLYSRRELLALTLLAGLAAALRWLPQAGATEDPNDFPVTNFGLAPTATDLASWRLKVTGAVATPLSLSYEELMRIAREQHRYSLDCVTGWSATRDWEGIPISKVMAMAQPTLAEPHLRFVSSTGYDVVMSRARWGATGALLATHVGGVPFSHDHGFPMRLLVPGVVGEENVKWLAEIRVLSV